MHMDANEGVRPRIPVLEYDKSAESVHGGWRLSYKSPLQLALKCSTSSETE